MVRLLTMQEQTLTANLPFNGPLLCAPVIDEPQVGQNFISVASLD